MTTRRRFTAALASGTCLLARAGAADPQPPLEVVTFNIRYLNKKEEGKNHWRERKQLVIDAMREFDADVFGLQEALRPQLDAITAALPGYTKVGVGRNDGKARGEFSPILFRTSRFKIDEAESGTFWLSDTPEKIGSKSWGNEIPRICTWARLTDRETERSFYVFNTHWDHKSQPSRMGAAKLIAERIAKRGHADEPVILMGDFNASRDNPAIRYLTGDTSPAPLRDSFAIRHPGAADGRTFHGFRGGKEGRKIDHIFVPPNSSVSSAAILYFNKAGRYPSDHYPVQAGLQFR